MLTSSGGGGRSMLTVADRGEGGDKICQNLADVICERSLSAKLIIKSILLLSMMLLIVARTSPR